MKLLVAADIRGCTPSFEQFLAALGRFQVDVGVVLGDLTGTVLVPMLQVGPSAWQTTLDEKTVRAETASEVAALKDQLERRGQYWMEMSADEFEQARSEPSLVDLLFKSAVRTRLEQWLERADQTVAQSTRQVFMSPGCNDWRVIDDLLDDGHLVRGCDGRIVPLESYDMVTVWSDGTPAEESVRAGREADIVAEMERLVGDSRSPKYVILNARIRARAVQKLVKRLQPMLYIFSAGESMGGLGGVNTIGSTVGLDPGIAASDEGNGGLRAALVELQHGRVHDYHHLVG